MAQGCIIFAPFLYILTAIYPHCDRITMDGRIYWEIWEAGVRQTKWERWEIWI